MKINQEISKGFWKENPVLVMLLGLCPTLATTTNITNAFSMGMAATFVLIGSNCIISLFRKVIPSQIRIPCYIVVIASFVTIVDLGMHAFLPLSIYEALGIFIPLIVVNCIILGRAEAFASRNGLWKSFLDAIGMGLGFTFALCLLGLAREVLGSGTIFSYEITSYFTSKANNPNAIVEPIAVLSQPAGAFLVIGFYLGLFNYMRLRKEAKEIEKAKQTVQ